jgi:hypothetical protein
MVIACDIQTMLDSPRTLCACCSAVKNEIEKVKGRKWQMEVTVARSQPAVQRQRMHPKGCQYRERLKRKSLLISSNMQFNQA